MVIKPVRLFCYIFLLAFWAWLYTTFNSNLIILNLQTNKIISLIYSATICEQRTLACSRSESFQHKPVSTTNYDWTHVKENFKVYFQIIYLLFFYLEHFSTCNMIWKISSYCTLTFKSTTDLVNTQLFSKQNLILTK